MNVGVKPLEEIALRPAGAGDDALLYALFCDVRGAMFDALPAAQKEGLLRMQFNAQTSGYAQNYPDAERMIVLVGGTPAGALIVQRAGAVWRLVDISLFASYRNRGIGARLMGDLIEHATESGRALRLQVARDNPARRLYERVGMRSVEEGEVYMTMESEKPAVQMRVAGFASQLNTNFILHDGTFFVLEQANELAPSGKFEQFVLRFRRNGSRMPQGTYELTHAVLGEIEIFLVPIAADTYEAFFSF